MLLGMEWYWWLAVVIILIVLIPLKVRFMRRWGRRMQEKRDNQYGRWGEEGGEDE